MVVAMKGVVKKGGKAVEDTVMDIRSLKRLMASRLLSWLPVTSASSLAWAGVLFLVAVPAVAYYFSKRAGRKRSRSVDEQTEAADLLSGKKEHDLELPPEETSKLADTTNLPAVDVDVDKAKVDGASTEELLGPLSSANCVQSDLSSAENFQEGENAAAETDRAITGAQPKPLSTATTQGGEISVPGTDQAADAALVETNVNTNVPGPTSISDIVSTDLEGNYKAGGDDPALTLKDEVTSISMNDLQSAPSPDCRDEENTHDEPIASNEFEASELEPTPIEDSTGLVGSAEDYPEGSEEDASSHKVLRDDERRSLPLSQVPSDDLSAVKRTPVANTSAYRTQRGATGEVIETSVGGVSSIISGFEQRGEKEVAPKPDENNPQSAPGEELGEIDIARLRHPENLLDQDRVELDPTAGFDDVKNMWMKREDEEK